MAKLIELSPAQVEEIGERISEVLIDAGLGADPGFAMMILGTYPEGVNPPKNADLAFVLLSSTACPTDMLCKMMKVGAMTLAEEHTNNNEVRH